MNLADVLLAAAETRPDALALVAGDETLTYGELARRAGQATTALTGDGVGPGDRVALAGHNSVRFVVAYLGVLGVGAIAVPLNPLAPGPEHDRECALVEPRVELGPLTLPGDLDAFAPGSPVGRDDSDVAVLLFTAGTAGLPRAARLTHGNLAANINQVQRHPELALRADDVTLGVLPVFHIFGLNVGLGLSLAAGASVVLVEQFDAAATLRLVTDHAVTIVAGVPAMYAAWLEIPDPPADAFASVRLAVSGAAPLPTEVFEAMRDRFGVTIRDGYGLTEASPIVTSSVLGADVRPGSIGPPLPGVDVRLVDVDGTDVLPGDAGEIWVRGPNVFDGYWNDDEATARVITPDGWLRTGDIAVIDDSGALTLVDRSKDLIIVSGFNVYPAEVEHVLLEHSDVAEAAVVGEPAERTGETVVAYVVAEPGHAPDAGELAAWCARSLARYKCPTRIDVLDALPRSFAGKVLRRELRPH